MIEINNFSRILFCFLVVLAACGQLSENEKFDQFFLQYEKMSAKQTFDNLKTSYSKTSFKKEAYENEIRLALLFCNKNLEKLDDFNFKKLSPENRIKWKKVFSGLKIQLKNIEKQAAALKQTPKLDTAPNGVVE